MAGYGPKEEIKAKLDIVEVISEYVTVKKAGASHMALCPFHNEKTPSMHVSPDKQLWYCHGCGEGGDIFGFVMRIEGLEYPDALRLLAKKAGVVLSKEDARQNSERQRLVEANTWAAKFWHEVLRRSPQAEAARTYVAKRALDDATVDEFTLGFSPDAWDATLAFLRKKGFKDDELFRAGLLSKRERGPGYFDRFRGRLMFPIADPHGNVVGFTARVMPGPDGKDPKDAPKYLNTQQTAIYNKSRALYGFHLAKRDIKKKDLAVVVEGNMDVIASHKVGVRNVVASSGTSLTEEQLELLKRFTTRLVLSFDNDPAGETAARRGIDLAVQAGFSIRVLRIPEGAGKDPDDCIRKDPAIWERAIADAIPFMEWYIALARERTDFHDPDKVREASQSLIVEVAKLPSAVERQFWVRELAELFSTPESAIFEQVQAMVRDRAVVRRTEGAARVAAAAKRPSSRDEVVSRHVTAMLLAYSDLAEAIIAAVPPDLLTEDHRDLYRDAVLFYTDNRHGEHPLPTYRESCERRGDGENADRAAFLELLAEKEFGSLESDARRSALDRLIGELKALHKGRRQRELTQAMVRAQKAGDQAAIQQIEEQFNELNF